MSEGSGEGFNTDSKVTYSCGWESITVNFDGDHVYKYSSWDDNDNENAGSWYMAFVLIPFFLSLFILVPYILKFIQNCHEKLDRIFNLLKSKQILILKIGSIIVCTLLLIACIIWGASQDCCQSYENEEGAAFGINCQMSISWYLTLFAGLLTLIESLYMWICWNTDKQSDDTSGEGYESVE